MKKLSILLLALGSGSVMAHSHSPTVFGGKDNPNDAISFTNVKTVPIVVTTLGDVGQKYDITVDGVKVNETPVIIKGNDFRMEVPVKINEPNVPQESKICSISVPSEGSVTYRTRICTKAQLYWVQK